jgi:hypothetical protein
MIALHEAAYKRSFDVFLKVWKWAEEKISSDDINKKICL